MKTIAWDIDDVLNDLMQSWFELKWLKDHPDCKVKYEGLSENPPHGILGVDINSYLRSLDGFRLSPLYQEMKPAREVTEWFERNGDNFRHIALTAVPLIAASSSAQWVFRHFGSWIRTFHFVPSKREGDKAREYDNDKGDFLKWIQKVDVLVDDSLANIKAAKSAGVKGIIIPRPWNKSETSIVEALKELGNI